MLVSIRMLITVGCLGLFGPIGFAQALEDLIADYEAFNQAGDPEEIARAGGVDPRQWADVSPDFIETRASQAAQMLETLGAIEAPTSTPEPAILQHLLTAHVSAHTYDTARIPFVGDWGFFAVAPFTAMRTRANTRAKAEAWTARLNDLPRFFDDHIANMRRGIETEWTQHGDPLATSIAQIKAQIVDDPTDSTLYLPYLSLESSDLSANEISGLRANGKTAVETAIAAYAELLTFMEDEYAPAARPGAGIAGLEGGQAAYANAVSFHTAGAGYSAEEIHQLGQSEVARIRADMESIIAEVEFDGSFDEFVNFLRTDPQFYAASAEELLEKASEMSKR